MTPEAFTHIALALRPKLQAIGRRFFADSDKAADVAQEVLMRLWLMRDRIDTGRGVEPLAVRMAKNYCVNEQKKAARLQQLPGGEGCDRMLPADDSPGLPHREGQGGEQLLSALSPYEQRLIRLRYEWDLPVREIAAIMGITPRSVSSIVSTAKRKLKQQLKKGGQL